MAAIPSFKISRLGLLSFNQTTTSNPTSGQHQFADICKTGATVAFGSGPTG